MSHQMTIKQIVSIIKEELRAGLPLFENQYNSWLYSFDCRGNWGDIKIDQFSNKITYNINGSKDATLKDDQLLSLVIQSVDKTAAAKAELETLIKKYGKAAIRKLLQNI